jgi:hypothetical protein
MHLLNSSHIQNKIERGWVLKGLVSRARGDRQELLRLLYVTFLSREPTLAEQVEVREYFKNGGVNSTQAMQDVAWALVNSKEFLYRH